jgi:hypothetical protein
MATRSLINVAPARAECLNAALKRAVEDAVLPAFEAWEREQVAGVRP